MTATLEPQPIYTTASGSDGYFPEQTAAAAELEAYRQGVNDYLASQNSIMESYVPDTVEEGDSHMAQYQKQAAEIVKTDESFTLHGVELDAGEAEAFTDMAEAGRNWWRMGEQEERDATAAVQADSLEVMPASMQSLLRNSKNTEGPVSAEELADFKALQATRLAFNEKLRATEAPIEPAGTAATEAANGSEQALADTVTSETRPATAKETPAPPELPAAKPTKTPRIATRRNGIKDLVKLDDRGYARYQNGKKMPKYELDVIEEHQDEIREGMDALEDRAAYIKEMRGMEEFAYKNWKDPSKGLVSDEEYEERLEKLLHEYDTMIFTGTAQELPDHPEQRSQRALKMAGRLATTALRSMMRTDRFMVEAAMPKAAESAAYASRSAVHNTLRGADMVRNRFLAGAEKSAGVWARTRGLGGMALMALDTVRPANVAQTYRGLQELQAQSQRPARRRR